MPVTELAVALSEQAVGSQKLEACAWYYGMPNVYNSNNDSSLNQHIDTRVII
jgi:hypothetical protein